MNRYVVAVLTAGTFAVFDRTLGLVVSERYDTRQQAVREARRLNTAHSTGS